MRLCPVDQMRYCHQQHLGIAVVVGVEEVEAGVGEEEAKEGEVEGLQDEVENECN